MNHSIKVFYFYGMRVIYGKVLIMFGTTQLLNSALLVSPMLLCHATRIIVPCGPCQLKFIVIQIDSDVIINCAIELSVL